MGYNGRAPHAHRLKPVLQAPRACRLKPVLRARSGFSLVELIGVISALSVVAGGAIVLMQFMLGLNGEVRERTHTIATLGRLAQQFRGDAHAARGDVHVAADRRSATFDLRGGVSGRGASVRWEIDDRGDLCRREDSPGKKPLQNAYRLPKQSTVAFELQNQAPAGIVALRIDSPGTAEPALTIEALVGRDERLAAGEGK